MNVHKLNLNLLRALDALLTEANVTRAAEKCFISQSAMSNALGQLRNYFNDDLLVRSPRGMQLTAKASLLQPKLHYLINELKSLMTEEPSFDPTSSTRVFKIGMSDIGEILLLPIILAKLQKQAPNVQLLVKHINHVTAHEVFSRGDIELATACLMDENSHLNHSDCINFNGMIIAKKNHPLMRKRITMKDYLNAKHIRVQYHLGFGDTRIDKTLESLHVQRDVVVSLPHITPIFFMLRSTELIASIPAVVSKAVLNKFNLAMQPLPFKMPKRHTYTVWNKVNDTDPGLIWLRSLIDEACKKIQMGF